MENIQDIIVKRRLQNCMYCLSFQSIWMKQQFCHIRCNSHWSILAFWSTNLSWHKGGVCKWRSNKSGCTNYCWVINKYQVIEESESYCGFLVWFLTDSCYISELSFNSDWQCESPVLQTAEQVKMSNKRYNKINYRSKS